MSKLFNTLRDVLTPYANKINLHSEEIEEIQGDVSEVKADLSQTHIDGRERIDIAWEVGMYIPSGKHNDRTCYRSTSPIYLPSGRHKIYSPTPSYIVAFSDAECSETGTSLVWESSETTFQIYVTDGHNYIGISSKADNAHEPPTYILAKTNLSETLDEAKTLSSNVKSVLVNGKEYSAGVVWEQGNINASTGEDQIGTNACRTNGFIVGAGTYVIDPNGQKTYIDIYDLNGTRTSGANWGKTEINSFTLDSNHKFRIVVMKTDSSALNPSNVNVSVSLKTVIDDFTKKKNRNCIFICHQGYPYDGSVRNNSRLEGYKVCSEHGFDYGETDCQMTLDGQLVGCHEGSFIDATSGDTIVIAEKTLVELKACDYYGSTIATIEEILIACKKYGIGLALDQLRLSYIDTLYTLAKKTGMIDNIAFLVGVGGYGIVDAILAKDSKATIMVLSSTATIAEHVTFANSCCNGNNKVYAYVPYGKGSASDFAEASATLHRDAEFAVWTINTPATIINYMPYVSGICSDLYCYTDIYPDL